MWSIKTSFIAIRVKIWAINIDVGNGIFYLFFYSTDMKCLSVFGIFNANISSSDPFKFKISSNDGT